MLILGQGVVRTRVLDNFASKFLDIFPNNPGIVIFLCLFFVLFLSAFLNNTPVVIIFIPIIQGIVKKLNLSVGRFMMPLSFVAILGGMTTLIGSSTNLLVSDSLSSYTDQKINFFDLTLPGSIIAIAGFFYVLIFSRFLLTDRSPMTNKLVEDADNHFIAQIVVGETSDLIGKSSKDGKFVGLERVKVLMIQRGEHAEHGPFDNFLLEFVGLYYASAYKTFLPSIVPTSRAQIQSVTFLVNYC